MQYGKEILEEIRSRNNIVGVIGEYVHLKKTGANYMGLCPFHNEKSPSFSVSEAKQMYHCFGCGESGDVFSFLQKHESMTFPEAVKALAERGGVTLPEVEDTPETRARRAKQDVLMEINREAAVYYYRMLYSEHGKIGQNYFQKRELSSETMKSFGLGYAPVGSDNLVRYLRSKNYTDKQIIEAGLASYDEKRGTHDKFWNRVMFPIMNVNKKVIGFGGRVMGDGKPKYLNSPETMIFDKSRNLYGLCFAKNARAGNMILCEGYMDVIAMHQAGFTQAVASLGTAFTAGQAQILKRYTDTVILSYDSDGAGTKAALRAIGILRDVGLKGRVLNLEPYKDPDEFIKALGREEFEQRLKKAENTFFFEVRILQRDVDMSDPDAKTAFYREIAKKLVEIREPIERENYLSAVAERFKIQPQALRDLVATEAAKGTGNENRVTTKPKSGIQSAGDKEDGKLKPQRVLLTWLAEMPEIYKTVKKYVTTEDFTDPLYKSVAEKVYQGLENDNLVPASIMRDFEQEEDQKKVAEIFNTTLLGTETSEERSKAVHDIIVDIKTASFEAVQGSLPLMETVERKKELENLRRRKITLES